MSDDQRHLYSGFITPRKDGYFGLTSTATFGLIGAAIVVFVTFALPLPGRLQVLILLVVIVALIPLMVSFRGRSGWEIALGSGGRSRQRRKKEHLGRQGPGTAIDNGTPLLALMADSEVTEHDDGGLHKFALVRVKPENYYTVVFRVWPQGREWVDQRKFNHWVANFGHLLSQIGQSPDVVGITSVVETLPESGQRVAREFTRQVSNSDAHPISQQVMWDAVFGVPSTEVRPEGRISVTFKADTGLRRRDSQEQGEDIARRMLRMIDLIEQAGLPCRPMTKREVIAIARRAMSPADEMAVEKALLTGEPLGIDWQDVGPAASNDHHGYFAHESARSISWVLSDPPKAPVDARVLDELLAPSVDLPRKRVCFIYRPHTPAEATAMVDEDLLSAERGVYQGRGRVSEHARVRLEAANRSRQEQALGAGVTRFTIISTVTVPADGDLSKAEALMGDRHVASRIRMRPAHDQQAVTFMAGLGLGLVLPAHASISDHLAA